MRLKSSVWRVLGFSVWALSARAEIPGWAPERSLSLGGYVGYGVHVTIPQAGGTLTDQKLNHRLNLDWQPLPSVNFVMGLRNQVYVGDSVKNSAVRDSLSHDGGYWDLSWNEWNGRGGLALTSWDRLYVDFKRNDWDARFGRQRIYWAMTTLWNPNDLFNTYSTFDYDYSERSGTDAVCLGRDLGFASRGEGVWALGKTWDETSLAARYQFNARGYDVHILGGKNGLDTVGGAGFAGNVGGAGLRGELSVFEPTHTRKDPVTGEVDPRSSAVATLESDYRFQSARNWSVKGDVLYISAPEPSPPGLFVLAPPSSARNLSFASWTASGEVGFDVTSLSRQTLALSGYDEGSWFGMVSNSFSLSNNVELFCFWQHFGGNSTSTFGQASADLLMARLRWNY